MDTKLFFLLSLFLGISSTSGDQTEDFQDMVGNDSSTSFQDYLKLMSTEFEVVDDFASYAHIVLKSGPIKDQSSEIQLMDTFRNPIVQGLETVVRQVKSVGAFFSVFIQPYVPQQVIEITESVKLMFYDNLPVIFSKCSSDLSACAQPLLKYGQNYVNSVIGLDCPSSPDACYQIMRNLIESEPLQAMSNAISAARNCIDSPSACLSTTFQTAKYVATRGLTVPTMISDVLFNSNRYDVLALLSGIFPPKTLSNICKSTVLPLMMVLLSSYIPLYLVPWVVSVGCSVLLEKTEQFFNSPMRLEQVANSTDAVETMWFARSYFQYHEKTDDECREFKYPFGMKNNGAGHYMVNDCKTWNALKRLYTGESYSAADLGLVIRHLQSFYY